MSISKAVLSSSLFSYPSSSLTLYRQAFWTSGIAAIVFETPRPPPLSLRTLSYSCSQVKPSTEAIQ